MIYATNSANTVYAYDNDLQLMWSDPLPGNNTSGVSLAPNGLMAVTGTNIIRVYTSANTGNPETLTELQVLTYPNPATEVVYISGSMELIGKSYRLYDGVGRIVSEGVLGMGGSSIPLDHVEAGVYFLHVESADIKTKIIKQSH